MRFQSKTIWYISMIALLGSSLLQIPARHYPQFHPDLLDGLRGLCLGIFFGATALTIWRNGRRAV